MKSIRKGEQVKMEQVQIMAQDQPERRPKLACEFKIALPDGELQKFLDEFYSLCDKHAIANDWDCRHWTETD